MYLRFAYLSALFIYTSNIEQGMMIADGAPLVILKSLSDTLLFSINVSRLPPKKIPSKSDGNNV